MTDRELLEFAAKAAGFTLEYIGIEWVGNPDELMPIYYEGKTYHSWNPRDDDGDALRLAVKLNMTLVTNTGNKMAFVRCGMIERYQAHDDDMPHALRKAIVSVAAEIGMAMK